MTFDPSDENPNGHDAGSMTPVQCRIFEMTDWPVSCSVDLKLLDEMVMAAARSLDCDLSEGLIRVSKTFFGSMAMSRLTEAYEAEELKTMTMALHTFLERRRDGKERIVICP